MKISEDEYDRRAVAEMLREVDVNYIKNPEDLAQALAVCVTPETDYNFDDFPPALFARLANLIDPTCHIIGTTSEEGLYGPTIFSHDLSCGHQCDTGWPEPPEYCYKCGARVVDDERGEVTLTR